MGNQKREVVAMILAGGQGSRLKELTRKLAKPAVPFGGKYRIIDFTLSNCSNSGIEIIGVLTQYHPFELNAHIGNGKLWQIYSQYGGIYILPPYVSANGGRWYRGTANAVYENLDFIDMYEPDHILVLSGDHIYKMDYKKIINYHKEKKAAVTIAAIEVPWEEASRFGVMKVDEKLQVVEFEEKSSNPSSNLASMGVYVFDYKVLKQYLIEDEKNKQSMHDFGKNIIPKMLTNKEIISSYLFNGYWKDVGTVESLWQANMDLLDDNNTLNLYDRNWKIYSSNPYSPPPFVSKSAIVQSSILNEGAIVYGEIYNSIIFPDTYIGKNSKIYDSVVMPNVRIEENVIINKAVVMAKTLIKQGTVIGSKDSSRIELVSG